MARTLRRLREEAGLTLEEAAPKLDWSSSKLSRLWTEALSARDSATLVEQLAADL